MEKAVDSNPQKNMMMLQNGYKAGEARLWQMKN